MVRNSLSDPCSVRQCRRHPDELNTCSLILLSFYTRLALLQIHMGLILIYSWTNGIKVKFLLCLACGYKIWVCILLRTLISEDLLIALFFFFFGAFPPPQITPRGCHFLLNAENDLACFLELWTIALAVLHSFTILGLSHCGYERQNIESLVVKHLCCEGWSLSRTSLLVIITLLYLHCSKTLIPSRSRGSSR